LISVVPYCDDSSINESEPGGIPVPQRSTLSWSSSSKNNQEDGHGSFELKLLKRRGQAGERTAMASASHSPVEGG
jgi:hypothetical protein